MLGIHMVGTIEIISHNKHPEVKIMVVKVDGKSRPLFVHPTKAKVIYDHLGELQDFVEKYYDPEFKGYTNEPQKS